MFLSNRSGTSSSKRGNQKMRSSLLRSILVSFGVMVYWFSFTPILDAQATAVSMKNEQPTLPAASKAGLRTTTVISPTDPVITISGLCSETQKPSARESSPCEKEITKQEFESLINAVDYQGLLIEPAVRKRFAETYSDLLLFERAAKRDGLSDTPQFRQILRWLSLRTMADMYYREVQGKNKVPTANEIDNYYQKHLSSFETVRLARILIPRDDYAIQDKNGEFDVKAQNAAKKAHERAVKGDDPDQIERDVYAVLGVSGIPPTDMGSKRREDFLPSEAEDVFRLIPGQVTQIEKEPRSYVIYKVISRATPTEAEIRDQISKKVTEERTKAAIQAVRNSARVDFNPQYFGSATPKSQPSAAVTPATGRH